MATLLKVRCLSAAVAMASEALLLKKCSWRNGVVGVRGGGGGKKVLVQGNNRCRPMGKAHGPKSR